MLLEQGDESYFIESMVVVHFLYVREYLGSEIYKTAIRGDRNMIFDG